MISEVIRMQCDIVRKYVKNPVFCTNLYGEIMGAVLNRDI